MIVFEVVLIENRKNSCRMKWSECYELYIDWNGNIAVLSGKLMQIRLQMDMIVIDLNWIALRWCGSDLIKTGRWIGKRKCKSVLIEWMFNECLQLMLTGMSYCNDVIQNVSCNTAKLFYFL